MVTDTVPLKTEHTISDAFLYSMIYSATADPPSFVGAFHAKVTCPSPGFALVRVGLHGTVMAVSVVTETAIDALEVLLISLAFTV